MYSVDDIMKLLVPDLKILEKGKERQSKIWRNGESDFLPIILSAGGLPEKQNLPTYNMKEQFFNKEKMLIEHLWVLIAQCRSHSDGQLSVRANLGTGFVPGIFGLDVSVFEDKMPWIEKHLSKEEILNLEFPEDIKSCGLVPRALEYIEYFKEKLEGKAHVYLSDTQGPFDIAHLVRGEEIFTDIYDDPKFVHHLMELSTRAYIEVTKVLKEAVEEDLTKGYHGQMYMGNGGVRVCEDTTTLLSPSLVKEFVISYTKKALEPFSGGWLHYCGNGNQMLDLFLELDEVKGVNFGNPEMHDYETVMAKLMEREKFYYGGWPKKKGETVQDYFNRILKPLKGKKKSLIFTPCGGNENDWQNPDDVISLWRLLHG